MFFCLVAFLDCLVVFFSAPSLHVRFLPRRKSLKLHQKYIIFDAWLETPLFSDGNVMWFFENEIRKLSLQFGATTHYVIDLELRRETTAESTKAYSLRAEPFLSPFALSFITHMYRKKRLCLQGGRPTSNTRILRHFIECLQICGPGERVGKLDLNILQASVRPIVRPIVRPSVQDRAVLGLMWTQLG